MGDHSNNNSKSSNSEDEGSIVFEHSLQAFFFDRLIDANKRISNPLPNEMLFYSSMVMDRFGESANYFSFAEDGSVSEKLLGIRLLESNHKGKKQQLSELKEIGDTALFLCGFFSDSVKRKLTDVSYYQNIGKIAYTRLNAHIPEVYEIQNFYSCVSDFFVHLMNLMAIISSEVHSSQDYEQFLLFSPKTEVG